MGAVGLGLRAGDEIPRLAGRLFKQLLGLRATCLADAVGLLACPADDVGRLLLGSLDAVAGGAVGLGDPIRSRCSACARMRSAVCSAAATISATRCAAVEGSDMG